jgi:hypothetical protein
MVGAKLRKTISMSKQTNKPATATNTPESNRPVHEIRVNGIRATIWANQTEKGVRHSIQFEKSYKQGDEYKVTDTYFREDALVLSYLAKESFRWIVENTKH